MILLNLKTLGVQTHGNSLEAGLIKFKFQLESPNDRGSLCVPFKTIQTFPGPDNGGRSKHNLLHSRMRRESLQHDQFVELQKNIAVNPTLGPETCFIYPRVSLLSSERCEHQKTHLYFHLAALFSFPPNRLPGTHRFDEV